MMLDESTATTSSPAAPGCPLLRPGCYLENLTAMPNPRVPALARCRDCSLVFRSELPPAKEIAALYDEEYFRDEANATAGGYENYDSDRAHIYRSSEQRLDLIERQAKPPGRMLDVGCALGTFLEAARARGWDVAGTDVAAYAVDEASKRLPGGDIRCVSDLRTTGWDDASFDAITMWDVLEHFPDPVDQLKACKDLLRTTGVLALYTPDVGSRAARTLGSRWLHYKGEHLFYFSPATLHEALALAGFRVTLETHIGKHVSLDVFTNRLGRYVPFLANPAGSALRKAGLAQKGLYVNPRDGLFVLAMPV